MKKFYDLEITNTNTTMKITKATYKKMTTVGTYEYSTFIKLRKDFPSIQIEFKTSRKETHKNLSFATMEAIIREHAETAEVMLKEFECVKAYGNVRKAKYSITKQWFLANYPNWKNYIPATSENNSTETMNKSA